MNSPPSRKPHLLHATWPELGEIFQQTNPHHTCLPSRPQRPSKGGIMGLLLHHWGTKTSSSRWLDKTSARPSRTVPDSSTTLQVFMNRVLNANLFRGDLSLFLYNHVERARKHMLWDISMAVASPLTFEASSKPVHWPILHSIDWVWVSPYVRVY